MTAILIIIGIGVLVIFRNDWKKTIYLLMLTVPFFGFIQLNIVHLTPFASLIHDITIILPMYFLFIYYRMKKKYNQFYLPNYFKVFLLFFIAIIIVFSINPFYETNFLVRVVGVKVWIFYLLFILIGFEFIESELELKKFCNFFAIVAIIPCVIGIFQYLGSYFIGHREIMTTFFSGNYSLADMSTQGFTYFDWGAGVIIYRLPSTFSFSAQFNVYTVCAFIPAITSVVLSKTNKEKYFYSAIVVLIILGSYASGIRATTAIFLLFLIFLILIQAKLYTALILSVLIVLTLSLVNLEAFPILQTIVSNLTEQTPAYILSEGGPFEEYPYIFENWFFGEGVGSATPQARQIIPEETRVVQWELVAPFHEGFYPKVVKELGVFGLLVVISFFIIIIYEILLSIRLLKDNKVSIFCSVVLAFFLIAMMMNVKDTTFLTKYPSSFLLYFFIGIAFKLRFLNLDNKK